MRLDVGAHVQTVSARVLGYASDVGVHTGNVHNGVGWCELE